MTLENAVNEPQPEKKKFILDESPSGCLSSGGYQYVSWFPWGEMVTLDGAFTLDELESITAQVREKMNSNRPETLDRSG